MEDSSPIYCPTQSLCKKLLREAVRPDGKATVKTKDEILGSEQLDLMRKAASELNTLKKKSTNI
jgi:hypothetical protein